MQVHDAEYDRKREAARKAYAAAPSLHSPYFNEDVTLGLEGFEHLERSRHGERSRGEQILRFALLPLALRVLRTATTVQEYRQAEIVTRDRENRQQPAVAEWWGFVAAFIRQNIKIRVVVRRVGTGKLHFWSVMLCGHWPFGEPKP
jgi:hypothetical protein